jgi:di/tricarboxylate transporter
VSGRLEEIPLQEIQPMLNLLPMDKPLESDLESRSITLVEVVLAPRSNLIGQTLSQVHFREKFDMSVIAIWRAGRPIRTGLSDLALQFGDGLLLLGPLARLETLRSEPNIILLSNGDHKHAVVQRKKGWLALAIMAASIVLASLYNASIGEIMLGGALAMVLVGILSMDEAYRSVDWKTIFIVAGMLPLGIALTETGAAASLGKGALALAGGTGPLALLAVLVILAMLLSQVMNGAAVTTIMVPVAISAASSMSLDARALVMGIALATSITFILPFGHPVNILVMGPGGYQMRDYLRVGLPLAVLLLILVIFLLPVIWPLSLI